MNIFFSDEYNKLTPEITALMHRASDVALADEFGEAVAKTGVDVSTLPVELSVSVVSRDEIQSINAEFRDIDKVTDVLSFPQFAGNEDVLNDLLDLSSNMDEDSSEVMGTLLGDVVICYDKAVQQAEEYGTGIKRELIYLFVHSIFHLFGYDHMNDEDKVVMRGREETVMEVLGL